jgi:hypothetical protein
MVVDVTKVLIMFVARSIARTGTAAVCATYKTVPSVLVASPRALLSKAEVAAPSLPVAPYTPLVPAMVRISAEQKDDPPNASLPSAQL